mgnify:CR=1 FL=1
MPSQTTFALFLMAALLACGCAEDSCEDFARAALSISVVDAASGSSICDATVVATDGSFNHELQLYKNTSGPTEVCSYSGAYEQNGTYTVTITAPQYQSQTQTVAALQHDECHVITQKAEIRLVR